MTNYPIGSPIFRVPIRYWEVQEPEPYVISQECTPADSETWVFVDEPKTGWSGYLRRGDIYFTRKHALEAAYLKWRLHDLRRDDDVSLIMAKIKGEIKHES
ncbi:MAG: hypothetical protein M0R80_04000 [Proteobacteria bacterium]|jgi:hypothetical protein|nr:hypothetical protein [Pseudomonadota bacterium]